LLFEFHLLVPRADQGSSAGNGMFMKLKLGNISGNAQVTPTQNANAREGSIPGRINLYY